MSSVIAVVLNIYLLIIYHFGFVEDEVKHRISAEFSIFENISLKLEPVDILEVLILYHLAISIMYFHHRHHHHHHLYHVIYNV